MGARALPGTDRCRTVGFLAKRYEFIDPLAVLPIYADQVRADLERADAATYRAAARRLAHMRALATGSAEADDVDQLIAELRETYRRRPRLQQEFDRALPSADQAPPRSR